MIVTKRTFNLYTSLLFAGLLIWAVVELVQGLTPLRAQIAADQELLAVTANQDLQTTLATRIATNQRQFWALLFQGLGPVLVLSYALIARVFHYFRWHLPAPLLPVCGLCCLGLLLVGGWFAPNLFNFVNFAVPATFFGVLPVLTGVKTFAPKK